MWVAWSCTEGNTCFISETSATSADNLLDTWIPINLFKCFESHHTPTLSLGSQEERSARSSLTVVLRLLGLDQVQSWDLEELMAVTADTTCFLASSHLWGMELISRLFTSSSSLVSLFISPWHGSCTCHVCDSCAMKDCSLVTLHPEHQGFCHAVILKSQCEIIMFW